MKNFNFLFLILIFHLLLLSRLTFTAWPEMLSYPYLLVNGFSLYRDFIMPYPPGLVVVLATFFNLFGFTPETLRILAWGLILTSDLLMYKILKKIINNSLITYLFLCIFVILQSFMEGNMLWFDLATITPLLIAFWFSLGWVENHTKKDLFLISFFITLAILIKQIAVVYFLAFSIFYILIKKKIDVFELGNLAAGSLVLIISFVIYLIANDSIVFFWNWTMLYPLTEWSKFPGYVDFSISAKYILITTLLLSPLAGILLNTKKFIKDKEFILTAVFLVSALIAVYPRFSFFHLQPAVAFAVILFAIIFTVIKKSFRKIYMGEILMSSAIVVALLYGNAVGNSIRFYNEDDKKLSQEIIAATDPNKRIYLLGLNSSQYVFAKKLPPSNWADNFGWYLEIPGVQEWILQGFLQNPPEKIFWRQPSQGKWYELGSYQPQKITEYVRQYYEQIGKIDKGIEIWSKKY